MGQEQQKKGMHPIIMMMAVIIAAVILTYIVGSGRFERHGTLVVPGTYRAMTKIGGAEALFAGAEAHKKAPSNIAYAASISDAFGSVQAGLIKNANLVFLIMLIGAMIGVLLRTGAVDAGIGKLIHLTGGRSEILIPILMIVLGLGGTFFGYAAEYLGVLPLVVIVGDRLGYDRIFAAAVVGVAAKVGYMTSITNPYAMVVAQPLAHVPLFSGMAFRSVLFVILIIVGTVYVVLRVRPVRPVEAFHSDERLSLTHTAVLACLGLAAVLLLLGSSLWGWKDDDLAAFYIALSLVFAIVGRLSPREAANAYVEGMQTMVLGALLIGLGASVQVILQESYVLDTLIHSATDTLKEQSKVMIANGLMAIEMFLGFLVPSTSGKAAVSLPILAPVARMLGLSGQTTVLAFILGNGLTNMIAPTSGVLLAYLAISRVTFGEWLRFVFPLFCILAGACVCALGVAVAIGY